MCLPTDDNDATPTKLANILKKKKSAQSRKRRCWLAAKKVNRTYLAAPALPDAFVDWRLRNQTETPTRCTHATKFRYSQEGPFSLHNPQPNACWCCPIRPYFFPSPWCSNGESLQCCHRPNHQKSHDTFRRKKTENKEGREFACMEGKANGKKEEK